MKNSRGGKKKIPHKQKATYHPAYTRNEGRFEAISESDFS